MKEDLRKKVIEKIVDGLEMQLIQVMKENLEECIEPYECKIDLDEHKIEIPEECKPVLEKRGFVIKETSITINPDNVKSFVYKELRQILEKRFGKIIEECQVVIEEIKKKEDEIVLEPQEQDDDTYEFYIKTKGLSKSMRTNADRKIACEFFKKYNLDFRVRIGEFWYFYVN